MDITLVFPHQLFADHPALQPGRGVALIEDPLLFGTDSQSPLRMHQQRRLLHRASMTAYAEQLRRRGFNVIHQRHHAAPDTDGHLRLLYAAGYRHFHLVDLVDQLLERRLNAYAQRAGLQVTVLPTPMLLTPAAVLEQHFGTGKKPLMAKFYEMQRKRLGVLMDPDGRPVGGRWSFDADNRKKLPRASAFHRSQSRLNRLW